MEPVADQPSYPFHVGRVYGVAGTTASRGVRVQPAPEPEPGRVARVSRLVAAVVPGRVDFSGPDPEPGRERLPMYTRPADRHAVATALHAGRRVDVVG